MSSKKQTPSAENSAVKDSTKEKESPTNKSLPAKVSAKPTEKSAQKTQPTKMSKPAANSGANTNKKKKKKTRKTIIWLTIVFLLMVAVVGGFFALQNIGIPVETATVETGDVAITVFATGALTAGESRDVYPETQGLIAEVFVADGDTVDEGDILARLDDAAAQAQVAQAEGALAQAKGGLAQAQSGQASAGAGTTAAQAGVNAAKAGLTSARNMETMSKDQLTSAQNVVSMMQAAGAALSDPAGFAQAQGAVTQAEIAVEQATAGVAQARAGVVQAEAALTQAQSANPAAAVTAARAGVEAAEAGLDLAQTTLDATVIRAPRAGMVLIAPTPTAQAAMGTGVTPTGGMELSPGSVVAPGQPVFSIVNNNEFSFTAEIDEIDIRKMAVGQSALVSLSGFSGEEFAATVSEISYTAKPTITGGTVFDIELSFDEEIPGARLGMKGDTTIEVETQIDTLTIPVDAWFRETGVDFVWMLDSENMLVKRPIQVGSSTEFVVEVLEGLDVGDEVVLAGGSVPFSEGLRVTPTP